ncbi:hypothetical protein EON64_10180, partial [archaeon]
MSIKTSRSRSVANDPVPATVLAVSNGLLTGTVLAASPIPAGSTRAASVTGEVVGMASGMGANVMANLASIRTITVPVLSNKLSVLVHQSARSARRPWNRATSDAAEANTRKALLSSSSTMQSNRTIKTLLAELDSNTLYNSQVTPATVLADSNMYVLVDPTYVRDMLEMLHANLHSPLQTDAMELYANVLHSFSAQIHTYMLCSLPVMVCSVRPIYMPRYMQPHSISMGAYTSKCISAVKTKLQSILAESSSSSADEATNQHPAASGEATKVSAFFYDPFQKKQISKPSSQEAVWYYGEEHTVQVCIYNPLVVSVAVTRLDVCFGKKVHSYYLDLTIAPQTVAYQHIPITISLEDEQAEKGSKILIQTVRLYVSKLYSEVQVTAAGTTNAQIYPPVLHQYIERSNIHSALAARSNSISLVKHMHKLLIYTSWDMKANKIFSTPYKCEDFTETLNHRFLYDQYLKLTNKTTGEGDGIAVSSTMDVDGDGVCRMHSHLSLHPNETRSEHIYIRNALAVEREVGDVVDYTITLCVHTTTQQKYTKVKRILVRDYLYMPSTPADELASNHTSLYETFKIMFSCSSSVPDLYTLTISSDGGMMVDAIHIEVEAYSMPKSHLPLLLHPKPQEVLNMLTDLTSRRCTLCVQIQHQVSLHVYGVLTLPVSSLWQPYLPKFQQHLQSCLPSSSIPIELTCQLMQKEALVSLLVRSTVADRIFIGYSLAYLQGLLERGDPNGPDSHTDIGHNVFDVNEQSSSSLQYCVLPGQGDCSVVVAYDRTMELSHLPTLYYAYYDTSRAHCAFLAAKRTWQAQDTECGGMRVQVQRGSVRYGVLCTLPSCHEVFKDSQSMALPARIYRELTSTPFFQLSVSLTIGNREVMIGGEGEAIQ